MIRYDIRHAKASVQDSADIIRYIAIELGSPETALRTIEAIDIAIQNLSVMPYRHPLVDDEHIAAMGFRKLLIKNYIAFYTIDEETKTVNIERILYARRDWLHML